MPSPTIVRAGAALAARLGVSRDLLHKMICTDPRWRACVIRKTRRSTWLSVSRMEREGFLASEQPRHEAPVLSYSWRI